MTPSERVLETQDSHVREQFRSAIDAYSAGQYDSAEGAFRLVAEGENLSDHDVQVVQVMLGKCLYAEGEYDLCLRHFDRLLRHFPQSEYESGIEVLMGHCRYRLGDQFGAARCYAWALAAGSDRDRQIALDNLEPLIRAGMLESEVELLADDLGSDPLSLGARLLIANRLEEAHARQSALAQYEFIARQGGRSDQGQAAKEKIKALAATGDGELVIGILAPLTGDYADFGLRMRAAAKLAAEDSRGKVRVVMLDTGNDPTRAAWAADSAVDAGCGAVIGPLLPDCAAATIGVLRLHRIVQVLPLLRRQSSDLTGLSPWLVPMTVPAGFQIRQLFTTATSRHNVHRLAALVTDTPEGHAAAAAMKTESEALGVALCATQFFISGETDFGPTLRRLKRSVPAELSENRSQGQDLEAQNDDVAAVDALVVWGADPEDLLPIVPQARAAGFQCRLWGDAAWGETETLESIRTTLDSAIFVSDELIESDHPGWTEFSRRYQELSAGEPDWLVGRVYDAVNWLASLAGEDRTMPLTGRMLFPVEFTGLSGTFRFGTDHQRTDAQVCEYFGGRIVPFEDSADSSALTNDR
ncbi:MAG: ABC transporter substrate-binding protein [candidate division Zixibacteria bacterium]|nr:ABC transporter substrate-binding protein [candidate division Zixibacteria bacterium]